VVRFRGYELGPNLAGVGILLLPLLAMLMLSLRDGLRDPSALVSGGFSLFVIALCLSFLRRGKIVAAADGMAFHGRRPRGLPAFVPWTDVTALHVLGTEVEVGPVEIELSNGQTRRIPRVERPGALEALW